MRYFRWIGLMSSLLFVGVLGGLMAPLPSEAVTSLTIKIDGTTRNHSSGTFLQSTTCSSTETTQGYNTCFLVKTSTTVAYGNTGRQYTIRNSGTAQARLRVGDFVGQDKFSLIGLKFVPVPWVPLASDTTAQTQTKNTTEQHTIVIITSNDFNSGVNVSNTSAPYRFSLRSGGEFIAGPTGNNCISGTTAVACTAVGDQVTYSGRGTFSPSLTNVQILSPPGSTRNTQTLSFTTQGPAGDPILSFDGSSNATLGQVTAYPQFACDIDGTGGVAQCRPSITNTMTVTLKGQDTFVLVGGADMFGASCAAQLSNKQEKQIAFLTKLVKILDWWEDRHENSRLRAFIVKIENFLATINNVDQNCPGEVLINLDNATAIANDQLVFIADGAVSGEPAPPHYYAVISDPDVDWETAKSRAAALGEGWHLATITSGAEQAIINSLLPDPTSLTGTKQYWIGGKQQSEAYEPGGNWQWINDEGTFWNSLQIDGQNGATDGMYQNWGNDINGPGVGLQPDNVGPQQNHLSLDNRYGWGWDDNDQFLDGIILGYVAEGPSPLPVD